MVKLGLALGGGGAKGSYQLGVLKAIEEFNILNSIKTISGTSIGAINTMLIMAELSVEEMIDIWHNLRNENIYSSGINLSLKTDELYNIKPLFVELSKKISNYKIRNSKYDCYVTAAEMPDNESRLSQFDYRKMTRKIFHLNDFVLPRKAVLASSSIPGLFGPTKILGKRYVDGGLLDNYSVEPLLNNNCNVILSVPLDQFFDATPYYKEKIVMLDFSSKDAFHSRIVLDLIDAMRFDNKRIEERFYYGYLVGKKVLEKLFSSNLINNDLSFKEPKKFILLGLTPDEDRKIYNKVKEVYQ